MVASSSTRSVLLSPGTRLLDGFASAVSLHGSRDAVVDGEERLTYSELDAASDRIAAAVIAAAGQDAASFSGREPGRDQPVVGVLLPRSLANTAAWAGAAKAGFAYAPMSLEWPAERIRKVVERCSMQVVLSEPRYWDRPGLESVTLVDAAALLREGDVPDARRQSCPDGGASLPLYVIHTSGSTGEPKGVLVSHDNVFTVLSPAGEYGLTPGSRLLHNIAVTFDLAMMEVWGALLHGGTIIVTQTDTVLDAPRLKEHLERHEVDWAILPTSVFNVLAVQDPLALSRLRDICICGEMPNRETIAAVYASCPETLVRNCYGPAECTIYASFEVIGEASLEEPVVPAGGPITASSLHILDDDLRVLGPEEVGEVAIGGDCVGLGYLGDPERTALQFVSLPGVPGRLYRTGDYGYLDASGKLVLLGRKDNQVKIHGNRVELGEVASALMQAGGVRLAHAAVTKGENKEIVAYLVPGDLSVLDSGETEAVFASSVREELRQVLPPYMVPRHFMLLRALPLNPHGKVNSSALPAPLPERSKSDGSVLGAFREILGNPRYSNADSFFDAGGSSLLAARLIVSLRDLTGVQPPLELFAEPRTAEHIASYLAGQSGSGQTSRGGKATAEAV